MIAYPDAVNGTTNSYENSTIEVARYSKQPITLAKGNISLSLRESFSVELRRVKTTNCQRW